MSPVQEHTSSMTFALSPSLRQPFKNIALALSGGGFRAASFSLGAMSYLHHLKYPGDKEDETVLDHVNFISSASGGTFTSMLYSMQVQEGKDFLCTYKTLRQFMNGQELLGNVLTKLNDPSQWSGEKSRNLINAFAKVYSERLFNHQTFGIYLPTNDGAPGKVPEVCFNATEFYRGLSFRFQANNQVHPSGKVGNRYVFFDTRDPKAMAALRDIRLGDIMAASSCFPAGFEPILFPDDFTYRREDGSYLEKKQLKEALAVTDYQLQTSQKLNSTIGLMDGGIDDNQAVYSMILANERRRKLHPENGFDLMLVTDVTSYFMDPYTPPEAGKANWFRKSTLTELGKKGKGILKKIRNVTNLSAIFGTIAFLASASILAFTHTQWLHNLALVVAVFTATILILLLVFTQQVLKKSLVQDLQKLLSYSNAELATEIKKQIPSLKEFSNNTVSLLLQFGKEMPIGVLEQMGNARLNSILSLVLDVNLKQIRRLIFNEFFDAGFAENRRVFNAIYELSHFNRPGRLRALTNKFKRSEYKPSADPGWVTASLHLLTDKCSEMERISESARTMGTTLWFEDDNHQSRMQDIIASGQFTTCAKLLEYAIIVERILDLQKEDDSRIKTIELDPDQLKIFQAIKRQLEADWAAFKSDGYFLYKKLSIASC